MATLLFTALGTLLGGPLGGAIGALAGRQVDSLVLGGGTREGPRLKELAVSTSSYGTPIPRHFGRMRVAGSIIWATDLVEHRDRQGGGKGKPSVVSYSYTSSFAVALSSRPIQGVGRIWADGKLLRGAAGDLKASGRLRIHTGEGDQPVDPRISAIQGAASTPAFRGLAYAVFEDLDLSDFGNRIPALTFEVIADQGPLSLAPLLDDVLADADADVSLADLAGLSCEGALLDTLTMLDPLVPMDCDANGDLLTIVPERRQQAPLPLSEAATASGQGDFGANAGFAARRDPKGESAPGALRFYDTARDYQPGIQRATGRPAAGQPRAIELPAALDAAAARRLIEDATRRSLWARQTLNWRVAELDPQVRPGALVTVPGHPGSWRVRDWEWREGGIELALLRLSSAGLPALPSAPGLGGGALDVIAPPSWLAAFELPWDGAGSKSSPTIRAALSSSGSGWAGAALLVDQGDGNLLSLGPGGRARSITGTASGALGIAAPFLFDRTNTVTIELLGADMMLGDASSRQLAMGANRALLGEEIIQFARAVPLGGKAWRLEGLLRGRGGTEHSVNGHAAGESFVLLDATPVTLDPAQIGASPGATIAAVGLGDAGPVMSAIGLRGITLRPLSPVHPGIVTAPDGTRRITWVRRARGGWLWQDGVDVPLNEQAEAYEITFGDASAPIARWETAQPVLDLTAATVTALRTALPAGRIRIRQRGDHALSLPLAIDLP